MLDVPVRSCSLFQKRAGVSFERSITSERARPSGVHRFTHTMRTRPARAPRRRRPRRASAPRPRRRLPPRPGSSRVERWRGASGTSVRSHRSRSAGAADLLEGARRGTSHRPRSACPGFRNRNEQCDRKRWIDGLLPDAVRRRGTSQQAFVMDPSRRASTRTRQVVPRGIEKKPTGDAPRRGVTGRTASVRRAEAVTTDHRDARVRECVRRVLAERGQA